MNRPMRHMTAPPPKNQIKALVEAILRARSESLEKEISDTGLTMSELLKALDWEKTRTGDLTATLSKLRDEGKVKFYTVPATSNRGRRFVRCYMWSKKVVKPVATPAPTVMDDRRYLSLAR